MRYCVDSPARDISAHILLPEGTVVEKVLLNGKPVAFEETLVGESHYVDFSGGRLKGRADIEILFLKPSAYTAERTISKKGIGTARALSSTPGRKEVRP